MFIGPSSEVVSGGHIYNDAVLAAWGRDAPGSAPTHVVLDGAWPDGPETAARLAAALSRVGRPGWAIVDGLVGAAHPQVLSAAVRDGVRITLLIHLPLPDETGLTPDRQQHLAALEREAVQVASCVLTTSHTAADDLRARYGRHDITVAAPGVAPAPQAHGSTPPEILCLAALTPRKNHVGLVAALARLTHLEWTAAFVGPADTPMTTMIQRALDDAEITERVRLTGELRGPALEEEWERADLLVLPSFAETYGLVVTEALARGVPAVVPAGTGAVEALHDHTPLPDVRPGTSSAEAQANPTPGLVVDSRSPSALAHAIERLLTEDEWRALARERRRHLRSWSATAQRLRAAALGVLDATGASGTTTGGASAPPPGGMT